MFVDAERWVSQCQQCLIAKGDYTEPKTVQGNLVASQLLELLCIDFTKADPSKGGKENILVLTTPHSTTGYQTYELMFGHKAPMPCDNWLGLSNYKTAKFKTKTGWLNEQLNALLYANKQALKGIQKSAKRNQDQNSGKDMIIPVGNHVLLHNHLEGRNKIQDRYKTDVYVVVGHHQEQPNVYYIPLLDNSKPGQPKVVNRHQLFDLKRSVPPSTVALP